MATENYFCVRHKNRQNVTNILNYCVSKQIYNLEHQLNIYMQKNKIASHKEYLLPLHFSGDVKKIQTDQSIVVVCNFFTFSEKKGLQRSSCEKLFLQC